ncbi:CYTH and CHAD domain-containing protein [Kineococcus rubinsiae]|uniref:CYTH and CHAD domain-containing protein n=1 Tax=Kineococcus rubinsiae TaxID=2609562 RepID=UPI001430F440|nr:CYTH and CHAD domain-containing protein [Kineococcus rubinsiae]NIZ92971.1 CYTH and CHAD domain-containing protein [Kineococcus rubinsiae]
MVIVSEELELKYDVDEDLVLPSLLAAVQDGGGAAAGLREVDAGEHQLEAVYFDTEDLRLAAAKTTLRRRSGGTDAGWHLKVPGPDGAREERHVPLGRAVRTVPIALRRMVEHLTAGAPLVPVAQLRTRRTLRHLLDGADHLLLEMADDHVEGRRLLPPQEPGQASTPLTWREVEVEVKGGDRALLGAADAGLRAAGLELSVSSSKVGRVLAGAAPAPSPRVRVVRNRPELSVRAAAGEVVLAHLAEQVDRLLDEDPRVRADEPDSVHRMRVATRRLRSALTTFSSLFSAPTRPLRTELKWLAGELGAARDAEVLRDRLAAAAAELDGPPVAEEVAQHLQGTYRTAHDAVLQSLSSARYERLLDALEALLAEPGFTHRGGRRAGKVLPRRVARTHRRLADLVERAEEAGGDERDALLHEARKAAKRVRYAAEAVTSVFGKDAERLARAATGLQEVLGEHQDSVVTRERLRDLVGGDVSPAVAFACGRLFEREQVHAAASADDVADAWAAVQAGKVRRWLR